MHKIIYKYELKNNVSAFNIPAESRILDVQNQNGVICVWILHRIAHPMTERAVFSKIPTGYPFKEDSVGEFIKTVQCGELVWHIFYSNG